MTDTTISPNMNLPIPNVSQAPGPDWASDYDACLTAIDSHNHSSGQGVPINPSGININSALAMNGNNLTTANSVGFSALVAAVTTLLRTLQVVSKDLYFVDGDGNAVRITQSGSVTGASGTITGLPSGTASASFSGGTFTWQSATNTPATMDCGPVITRSTTASSKGVTLAASASQPADYGFTWPLALAAGSLTSDVSGNLSIVPIGTYQTATGTIATLTGGVYQAACSITLTAGTWMIFGGVLIQGVTASFLSGTCALAISTTSASITGTVAGKSRFAVQVNSASNIQQSLGVPGFIVTPVGSTIYYLNVYADQAGGQADGSITAVRIA